MAQRETDSLREALPLCTTLSLGLACYASRQRRLSGLLAQRAFSPHASMKLSALSRARASTRRGILLHKLDWPEEAVADSSEVLRMELSNADTFYSGKSAQDNIPLTDHTISLHLQAIYALLAAI